MIQFFLLISYVLIALNLHLWNDFSLKNLNYLDKRTIRETISIKENQFRIDSELNLKKQHKE